MANGQRVWSLKEMNSERARFEKTIDDVYVERNAVVVAFAKVALVLGWPVGVLVDPEAPGWPVLVIDSHEGQISWHIPQAQLPEGFDPYPGEWDGHSTDEKYGRLAAL